MARIPSRTTGRFHFLILVSFAFGSLVWAAGPNRQHGTKPIIVTDTAGKVDVTVDNVPRHVRVDSILPLPARVVTGSDGVIAIRQVETTVSIAPDSDIEIPETARDGQLIARMIQHRGNAFYDVETREVERLHVETPYLVAVVKGTQFNVAVLGTTSTISLFEGSLEIRNPDGGESIELEAGEIAIRSEGDAAIRVVRMNAAVLPEAGYDTAVAARPDDANRSGNLTAGLTGMPTAESTNPDLGLRATLPPDVGTSMLGGEATALNLGKTTIPNMAQTEIGLEIGIGTAGSASAALDTGLDVGIDLGGGSAGIDVRTSVDLGGASADLGLDAGIDLGGGSVDLGLDGSLDVGGTGTDLGAAVDVDLGGGSADLGLDGSLDIGGASTDLGAAVDIDLGGNSGLNIGTELDLDAPTDEDTGGVVDDLLNRLL